MTREFDMCDVCKCDKAKICDYECIKQRSDFMFRFFTCPRFLYDDGITITNAERIAMELKEDPEFAAMELWYQIVMNDGCIDKSDFVQWLKEEADFR